MRDLVSKNNSRFTSGLHKAYMCMCERTTRTHAQRHGMHIHKAVKPIFINTELVALEPGCFTFPLTLYDADPTQFCAPFNHSIASGLTSCLSFYFLSVWASFTCIYLIFWPLPTSVTLSPRAFRGWAVLDCLQTVLLWFIYFKIHHPLEGLTPWEILQLAFTRLLG